MDGVDPARRLRATGMMMLWWCCDVANRVAGSMKLDLHAAGGLRGSTRVRMLPAAQSSHSSKPQESRWQKVRTPAQNLILTVTGRAG